MEENNENLSLIITGLQNTCSLYLNVIDNTTELIGRIKKDYFETLASYNKLSQDYLMFKAETEKRMNLVSDFIRMRGFSEADINEFETELKFNRDESKSDNRESGEA